MQKRPVIVINQYAMPRDQGGVTRNIDLFGRLAGWEPTIISSNYSHTSHEKITTDDKRFVLVPGTAYSGNGISRVLGWGVFTVEAFFAGLPRRARVVFSSSPHIVAPIAALVLARIKRVPFVLEVRDLWPESIVAANLMRRGSRVHRILIGLERFLYHQADHIVAVVDGWQDHMTEMGISLDKVTVVPNGTELTDFQVTQSRDELRRHYGITGYTAVYAGSIGRANAVDKIITAARELPDINFLIVGGGPEKEALVRESADLPNVTWRDPVPKAEVPAILHACDVGLQIVAPLPVLDYGMSPNKLFDYLAAGLPIVSNAKHPLRNVIVDDQVGAVGGPDDIAEGLRRVRVADEATLTRWHDAAMELMSTKYSRSAVAATLEDVLNSVAQRRGARPSSSKPLAQRASEAAGSVVSITGSVASAAGSLAKAGVSSLASLVRRARTPK